MELGPWTPDLPDYGHKGLVIARNVYASAMGYQPFKALSALTGALGETWRGGGAFRDVDGTTATLAGADAGLYSYASGAWTFEGGSSYSSKWFFAQFGPIVIAANGAEPLKYTISTSTAAALGGTPPDASMIAVVRDFVFLAGDPAANTTVTWSAINNAEGWTIGTDQCDSQVLPDGGPITGLAGGEYGLVFQEAAIHRFSYVGTPLIFQRDKVSESIGCITPGAIAQFGRMVFFLSPRGFYAYIDGELDPIGKNQIDETFWRTYPRADVVSYIYATIDPERSLVVWSMPDRLWCYHWDRRRWSEVAIPGIVGVTTGIIPSVSLEDIDTLYPGGIDTVPVSLDDPGFQGGATMLAVAMNDGQVYSFGASSNLQATLRAARQEFVPGRDARVWGARIVGDMVDGTTLSIDYSQRLGDAQGNTASGTINPSGRVAIRATGRYMQPQVVVNEDTTWDYVVGLDLMMAAGGSR